MEGDGGGGRRVLVAVAFLTVYIVWGSTYLAIRFAIESLPPLLMAAMRFLVAGAVLYGVLRWRGEPRPTAAQWRGALVVGALLLLMGNGLVVLAEQVVVSGVAALLVATVPFWMVLFEWMRRDGDKPTVGVGAGLLLGFAGVVVLVGPGEWAGGGVNVLGAAGLLLASVAWAGGAIYSRSAPSPRSPLMGAALQMVAGGSLLLLVSTVYGDPWRLEADAMTVRSVLAWAYLVVFGSLAGFTAYMWLLRVSTPAKVSTTAYVNPVVAVLLGWALANEPLTPRVLAAVALIVGAVAAMTRRKLSPRPAVPGPSPRMRAGGE